MSWTHQVHSCLNISDIYGCQENPNSLHPSLPNSMKIAFTKLSPRALIAAFPRMRFSIQMKDFSRDWLCAQFEEDKTVTWWCDNCENCDKKSFAVFSRISQSLRAICPLFPFFKRSDQPFLFPIAFISAIVFQLPLQLLSGRQGCSCFIKKDKYKDKAAVASSYFINDANDWGYIVQRM